MRSIRERRAVSGPPRTEDLAPTRFIESDHPAVAAFARERTAGAGDPRRRAIALFDAVRDGIRYDPWAFDLDPEVYRATTTLARGRSFCIPKAILLVAAARALGIPARLAFADVRNHLASDRLLAMMKTDVFAFHGYAELWLDGRWVKATPTFDRGLCERFDVHPLEFDGVHDAILHPFDREGKRHMEYLRDRGRFSELPLDEVAAVTRSCYPHLFDAEGRLQGWLRAPGPDPDQDPAGTGAVEGRGPEDAAAAARR